ncbi:ABC transporter substrate-binding protein [Dermacoccaceae bacterium W4C1]
MRTTSTSRLTPALAFSAAATLALVAGCADPQEKQTSATVTQAGQGGAAATARVINYDSTPTQSGRIKGTYDAALAAQLPEKFKRSKTLVVANTSGAGGTAPLTYLATDNKTPIGVEVDLAYLLAEVLGLKVQVKTSSFENLFVGIDSGKYDVALSNVGVSEERKKKYDLATYRLGLHAFETRKNADFTVKGAADLAGKKVAVSSGTLQEEILLRWNEENKKAGREPIDIKYYQNSSDYYIALSSGRIDAYLGPNPVATYHVATSKQTKIVGTVSSSYPVVGKVGTLTKRGNDLAPLFAKAINKAIADGSYAKVLDRWGLNDEAVPTSQVNPPGLPERKTS